MSVSLPVTGDPEADQLLVDDPLALLIGMLLDQQVPMEWAFGAPLKLRERLGGKLDAATIAATDPAKLEEIFKGPPALHRFPGSMAKRVQALTAHVAERYDGDAARVWEDAADGAELRANLEALPGFGEMKVKALGAVLAKRFGVAAARELVPWHPTLGDVDSREALARYQAAKRAHKQEWSKAAASR